MGITRQDLESKFRLQFKDADGYKTFYLDSKPVCFDYRGTPGEEDQYCANPAGAGTDHPGKGKCKMHDQASKSLDRLKKNGRYAFVTQERFQAKMEQFLNDPELLNLHPELAILRVLASENWEKYQRGEIDKEESLRGLIAEITGLSKTVDKINSNQVLTATNARYLMLRAVDVMQELLSKWFSLEEIYRLSTLPKEDLEALPQERLKEFLLMWRKEVENKVG